LLNEWEQFVFRSVKYKKLITGGNKMKNQLRSVIIFGVSLLFVFSILNLSAFAQKKFEGYWESEIITNSTMPMQPKQKTEQQKSYYKEGKWKNDNLTDKQTMIFRFDKELAWTINHNDKSYYEMTFEQMQQGVQKAKGAMADAMKDMDPAQRERMKKMMGNKMGGVFGEEGMPAISFEQTGKKKSIQGYDCHLVIMKLGEDPLMEMWLTNKFNIGHDFIKTYEKMGLFKGDMPTNFDLKGFPIYTVMDTNLGMGKMKTETTVKKIVATSVSDNEFDLPRGYKKLERPMAF
jgi:hypothetical protein